MRALFRLAPLMAFGPWFPSWAAEPVTPLDLGRVRTLAEQRAPGLKRAETDHDVARIRARRDALGVALVPSLSAAPGLCLSGGPWFCGELSVSVPLPVPGERTAAHRVGETGVGTARVEVEAARAEARTEASLRYLDVLAARALRELAEEASRVARAQLEAQELRVRTGDAADMDRLQAAEALARRSREAEAALVEEQAALDALRRALLLAGDVTFSETLTAAVDAASRLAEIASGRVHPRLASARARMLANSARAELAATLGWPRVSLQGTYQNEPGLHAFFVGVTIPLTGLSSVARAELAVARAREHRAEREAELIGRELDLARDAAGRLLARVRSLRAAAATAVERQRAIVATLRRAHAQKQIDLFRLLFAEEALVRSAREELRAAHSVGRAALLVAAGGTP